MQFLRYKALKSVMGSGRAGPGRVGPRILRFSLKYERTRSARSARSLVINKTWILTENGNFSICLKNYIPCIPFGCKQILTVGRHFLVGSADTRAISTSFELSWRFYRQHCSEWHCGVIWPGLKSNALAHWFSKISFHQLQILCRRLKICSHIQQ